MSNDVTFRICSNVWTTSLGFANNLITEELVPLQGARQPRRLAGRIRPYTHDRTTPPATDDTPAVGRRDANNDVIPSGVERRTSSRMEERKSMRGNLEGRFGRISIACTASSISRDSGDRWRRAEVLPRRLQRRNGSISQAWGMTTPQAAAVVGHCKPSTRGQ